MSTELDQELERELNAFGDAHIIEARREVAAHNRRAGAYSIRLSLMLAIGSRESDLLNVVGDRGHGRGWLQIDDRFHPAFLRENHGCRSGSWRPDPTRRAIEPGYCPSLPASIRYAMQLLDGNARYLAQHGFIDPLRAAVSAYNCGAGNVRRGWRERRDIDAYTTGGNYGRDVYRRADFFHRWGQQHNI